MRTGGGEQWFGNNEKGRFALGRGGNINISDHDSV